MNNIPKARIKKLAFSCFWISSSLFVLYILGGILFIHSLQTTKLKAIDEVKADGIVALTGISYERITKGLLLLKAKRGERLLISGVGQNITKEDILQNLPPNINKNHPLFACCVDIGTKATNTFLNAVETKQWVDDKQYDHIIVVTSIQHMKRAMVELHRQMPNVLLTAFPIIPKNLQLVGWWHKRGTLELLWGEYTRYILSLIHLTRFV